MGLSRHASMGLMDLLRCGLNGPLRQRFFVLVIPGARAVARVILLQQLRRFLQRGNRVVQFLRNFRRQRPCGEMALEPSRDPSVEVATVPTESLYQAGHGGSLVTIQLFWTSLIERTTAYNAPAASAFA
jgi:hypothetical protein